MKNALEVDGLNKSFGALDAVKDLTFDLGQGELLALIGPNGAGKSTCFNMLSGQIMPDSGSVKFKGRQLVGLRPRQIWRLGVGRTFQITATYSSMTVRENVQMALISHYRKLYSFLPHATTLYVEEAEALLERVGLQGQAERAAAILAYGDLKRLELAIALANNPDLLLMDEPTAGMAPKERIGLMQLTGDIVKQEGISVLFTEHDMDVVFSHAHRIIVLNRGELLAEGTEDEIRSNPKVQEVYLGGGITFSASTAGVVDISGDGDAGT